MFPRKLKSRFYRPLTVVRVFSYGENKLKREGDSLFKVDGHRVKHYIDRMEEFKKCEDISLGKVWVTKAIESYCDVK